MNVRKLAAGSAVAIAVLAGAQAAEKSPVDEYAGTTKFELMKCTLQYRLQVENQRLREVGGTPTMNVDYLSCVSSARDAARTTFDAALRSIKKPAAKEALKHYHVTFVTALAAITPGFDERKISYEQRQQALQDKLTEAWARFELEQ